MFFSEFRAKIKIVHKYNFYDVTLINSIEMKCNHCLNHSLCSYCELFTVVVIGGLRLLQVWPEVRGSLEEIR